MGLLASRSEGQIPTVSSYGDMVTHCNSPQTQTQMPKGKFDCCQTMGRPEGWLHSGAAMARQGTLSLLLFFQMVAFGPVALSSSKEKNKKMVSGQTYVMGYTSPH